VNSNQEFNQKSKVVEEKKWGLTRVNNNQDDEDEYSED